MQSDAKQRPFFVYGTLLPGQPNFSVWEQEIMRMDTAVFSGGLLFDMGQYPMLVEADRGEVHGRLIHVKPETYTTLLRYLDRLEGFDPDRPEKSIYRRVLKKIVIGNGQEVEAWIYLGRPHLVGGLEPVENGDWAAYIAHQAQWPPWWQALIPGGDFDEG